MTLATLSDVLQPALKGGYAVAGLVTLGWEDMRAFVAAVRAGGPPPVPLQVLVEVSRATLDVHRVLAGERFSGSASPDFGRCFLDGDLQHFCRSQFFFVW